MAEIIPPLAKTTGERPPSKTRDQVIAEAKRLEESTLFSCKGHHEAAQSWKTWHLGLGLPTVVISALVGVASFTTYTEKYPYVGVVGVIFSFVVPVLSGISTFFNPNEKQAAHFAAAHGYDRLNNAARMFWSIDCWATDATDEGLTAQLKSLVAEKDELNKSSPQIPRSAYTKAKKGIEDGEASFKVDRPV
ncbi:SLATT domain-containing protein [Sinorhizobium meliloti]|uniref:SLATT domain-containing protein n=1 Tax=Rhizobium meliloti TaxID=382 RepID=UPI0013E3DB5F|nr:SLATT domain-containing protein [Sinorhizobium meliloti]MDE3795832.1 SLATT domain-containing protein [Sinorhizobium meliloti]